MEVVTIIATTLGVGWASGINLYAATFMLGWMGTTGAIDLPPDLEILEHPLVLTAAAVMYGIEFVADKIPGVDTGWDVLHSFVRIPAGALLAAGAMSPLSPEAELVGALLGGTLAAGSHFTKAGTRVLANTSPEPVSNWSLSLGEDVVVIAGLWTALNHPVIFIVLLVAFIALVAWLLPKLWRGIKRVLGRLRHWLGGSGARDGG